MTGPFDIEIDMTEYSDEELAAVEYEANKRVEEAQAAGSESLVALRIGMAATKELSHRHLLVLAAQVLAQPKDQTSVDAWAESLAKDMVTAGEIDTLFNKR